MASHRAVGIPPPDDMRHNQYAGRYWLNHLKPDSDLLARWDALGVV